MMNALIIIGTDNTPDIILDKTKSIYRIEGRSFPDNVIAFYKPVLEWLDIYANAPAPTMDFEIKLDFFNTASSRILLDILMKLECIHENGHHITVKWFYEPHDEDIIEAGEEYSELVTIPFEKIQA